VKSKPLAIMERSATLQPVILVTGGNGLLGSRLIPLLARNLSSAEIIAVTRNENRFTDLQIKTIPGDLRDENLWTRIPDTITHVFHLAAVIPWRPEERYNASVVRDNLLPIANLIQQSHHWSNLQQVVYSSSVSVYAATEEFLDEDSPRQPANLYGAAKLAGEVLLGCLENVGVSIVSLRFSSLYGRGQYEGTVLPIMVSRARQGEVITIFGNGTRTQDFLHCEDAARAILLSFQKRAQGVYNIGTGTPVSMAELAEVVNRVFTAGSTRVVFQPEGASNDPGIKLDISKARRELDYQPQVDLESGLQQLKQELTGFS
jgi:UDP-glucose 4-epimerase